MKLHRIIIGIQLNKKIFRLASVSGLLVDTMLDLRNSEKSINDDYFTRVSSSNNVENMHVSISNEDKSHELIFQPSHITLRIGNLDNNQAVSIEKAHKEFELFWKSADKIINFPAVRSIGIVAEYRFDEKKTNSASNELMNAFLKNSANGHAGRFHLQYEDKALKENGEVPDTATDGFCRTTYTYYSSDRDETPEDGKINANIDFQNFYAPAKSTLLAELRKVKEKFVLEKKKFKKSLISMGFE